MKKIIWLLLSAGLVLSCAPEEDNDFTIVATIDGVNVNFVCNRNFSSIDDQYNIGCQHGFDTRLNFYKDADDNGGALKVEIVDVPNTVHFDSDYGIHYICTDVPGLYDPQCSNALPQYDQLTTELTFTGVVVPFTSNTTGNYDPTETAGPVEHTITTSIVLGDVPYFQ